MLVGVAMLHSSAFEAWLGWPGIIIGLLLVVDGRHGFERFQRVIAIDSYCFCTHIQLDSRRAGDEASHLLSTFSSVAIFGISTKDNLGGPYHSSLRRQNTKPTT